MGVVAPSRHVATNVRHRREAKRGKREALFGGPGAVPRSPEG
jgi:hypothetical protein